MHLVLDHVATHAGTTSVTGGRFDVEDRGGHSHFARGHLGPNAPERIKPRSNQDQRPSLAQTDPKPKPVESRFDFWP